MPAFSISQPNLSRSAARCAVVFSCFFVLLEFALSSGAVAQESRKIDLRLFGKNVVADYAGCHLAFWQANKSPQADNYSYVLYAPFNDGEELPAWMKVGKDVYELSRQDDGMPEGQGLEPLRLYRTSKGTYTVLVEVIEQHLDGGNILVDRGRLIITQQDHDPFVISVKGGLLCPKSEQAGAASQNTMEDILNGSMISLSAGRPFDSLSAVPKGVLDVIRQDAPDCEPASTAGSGMRYAVSDDVSLWEVPCNLYARTGSSVYVSAFNENSDYSNLLIFPATPGREANGEHYEIRNPQMNASDATVVSAYYDGDGSCGSYEAYQLRAVEGEALEFFLLEYREKPQCDGKASDAKTFPLVYSSQ